MLNILGIIEIHSGFISCMLSFFKLCSFNWCTLFSNIFFAFSAFEFFAHFVAFTYQYGYGMSDISICLMCFYLHNKFLDACREEGIDECQHTEWTLCLPTHALQKDGESCGVYVLQVI